MHVDDFIDRFRTGPDETYARWFFHLQRLPAALKIDFKEWIDQYRLYCRYEGNLYRVTGCSRYGDVWLTSDLEKSVGYELRVNLINCSEWTREIPK